MRWRIPSRVILALLIELKSREFQKLISFSLLFLFEWSQSVAFGPNGALCAECQQTCSTQITEPGSQEAVLSLIFHPIPISGSRPTAEVVYSKGSCNATPQLYIFMASARTTRSRLFKPQHD